jgi:hypothetical protein
MVYFQQNKKRRKPKVKIVTLQLCEVRESRYSLYVKLPHVPLIWNHFFHFFIFLFFPFFSASRLAMGPWASGKKWLLRVFFYCLLCCWCGGDAFLRCCCDASENDSRESLCVCVASVSVSVCVYDRDFLENRGFARYPRPRCPVCSLCSLH